MQLNVKVDYEDNSKDAIRALSLGIDHGLDDIIDFIYERSQKNVPKDESTLQKSALPLRRDWMEKEIEYRAFYASYIEYGTDSRERMPPVDAIERWVKRKGIAKGKNIRSTAFAIARYIQKNGTRPQPFLRPAKNEADVRKNEIMQKAVKRELARHKKR
ncbi:MAG: hypothetical protein ACT6FG_00255 [Methanosarcinaceae archaeon]